MPGPLFIGPLGWPRPVPAGADDPLAGYRSSDGQLLLTHGGRTATDLAVRALRLGPGDRVLVPAYSSHCELHVLRRHGVEPVFYSVDAQLHIDPAELERRADPRVRALYLIHYFGFPQPAAGWQALARARGWAVIEDCAHALYAREEGQLIGTRGDVAIFSFQKTLGTPDGGLLWARPGLDIPAGPLRPPPLARVAGPAVRQWLLGHAPARMLRWAHELARSRVPTPAASPEGFHPDMVDRGPSGLTRRLLARGGWMDDAALRRAQFAALLAGWPRTPRTRPLLTDLPPGACPLFFPIWCDRRDEAQGVLTRCGVVAYRWWSARHPGVPREGFPEVDDLKRHVLVLPVHNQLAPGSLSGMLEAIRTWAEKERVP